MGPRCCTNSILLSKSTTLENSATHALRRSPMSSMLDSSAATCDATNISSNAALDTIPCFSFSLAEDAISASMRAIMGPFTTSSASGGSGQDTKSTSITPLVGMVQGYRVSSLMLMSMPSKVSPIQFSPRCFTATSHSSLAMARCSGKLKSRRQKPSGLLIEKLGISLGASIAQPSVPMRSVPLSSSLIMRCRALKPLRPMGLPSSISVSMQRLRRMA